MPLSIYPRFFYRAIKHHIVERYGVFIHRCAFVPDYLPCEFHCLNLNRAYGNNRTEGASYGLIVDSKIELDLLSEPE